MAFRLLATKCGSLQEISIVIWCTELSKQTKVTAQETLYNNSINKLTPQEEAENELEHLTVCFGNNGMIDYVQSLSETAKFEFSEEEQTFIRSMVKKGKWDRMHQISDAIKLMAKMCRIAEKQGKKVPAESKFGTHIEGARAWTKEEMKEMVEKMTSGSYQQFRALAKKHLVSRYDDKLTFKYRRGLLGMEGVDVFASDPMYLIIGKAFPETHFPNGAKRPVKV